MHRHGIPILSLALSLAAGLAFLGGCGDDATTPDDSFQLTVVVTDSAGDPVPDLDLVVLMDSPYYQDGLAAKARVTLGWTQPQVAYDVVTIEDAAGAHLRTVVADSGAVGRHEVSWDGRDDAGAAQVSGLYWVRYRASDFQGNLLFEDRQPMYMALMAFPDGQVGTTDADGRIVLDDKRLFPKLFGDMAMTARNELGEAMGDFPLTSLMRFYLRDSAAGVGQRFDREVTGTGGTLALTWAPLKPRDTGPDPAPAGPPLGTIPVVPPAEFGLTPPFPNPFN